MKPWLANDSKSLADTRLSRCQFTSLNRFVRLHGTFICRLLVDQLAGRSMKDTASCAKECELQDT